MSGQNAPENASNAPTSGAGVRRHHTISASSRPARGDGGRATIPEDIQLSTNDEVVDEDWVGPIGAVGENSAGLHRQASLPTRYHRGPLRSHDREMSKG